MHRETTVSWFSERPCETHPADGDFEFGELVPTGVYEEPWQTNHIRNGFVMTDDYAALNLIRIVKDRRSTLSAFSGPDIRSLPLCQTFVTFGRLVVGLTEQDI